MDTAVDFVRTTVERAVRALKNNAVVESYDTVRRVEEDLTHLFPRNSSHYFLNIMINGKKVTCVVDNGSNSSILSVGAC